MLFQARCISHRMIGFRLTVVIFGRIARCDGAVHVDEASCHLGKSFPQACGNFDADMVQAMAFSSLQKSLAVQWRGGEPTAGMSKHLAESDTASYGRNGHQRRHERHVRTDPANATDAKIPNLIFMAGPWLPDDVIKQSLPFVPHGTEFRYSGYGQVDSSALRISNTLESSGVSGAYAAMSQLRPWSFRMDLWRYMILWENGGYYLDSKFSLRQNLSSWVHASNSGEFVACKNVKNKDHVDELLLFETGGAPSYQACVIAARPKEPMLLKVIGKIIENVQYRWYGPPSLPYPWLYVTGPGLLERVLDDSSFQPRTQCAWLRGQSTEGDELVDARIVSEPSGATVLISSKSVHEQMRACSACNSYQDLYDANAVYCDEPVPPGLGDDPCARDFKTYRDRADWLSIWK